MHRNSTLNDAGGAGWFLAANFVPFSDLVDPVDQAAASAADDGGSRIFNVFIAAPLASS